MLLNNGMDHRIYVSVRGIAKTTAADFICYLQPSSACFKILEGWRTLQNKFGVDVKDGREKEIK